MLVFGAAGGVLLVTGIVLHQMGLRSRRRAEEAAKRSVTLVPLLSPGARMETGDEIITTASDEVLGNKAESRRRGS